MNSEVQESQLSAMFDGELTAAECDLLSRRLGREDALRQRWARYALIGAAMRTEPARGGGPLAFAGRVQAAIDTAARQPVREAAHRVAGNGVWQLAAGAVLAAAVAGVAIFWLRTDLQQRQDALVAADNAAGMAASGAQVAPVEVVAAAAPAPAVRQATADQGTADEPLSYVVPVRSGTGTATVPPALANFVVAHSEYSSPLARRSLLSALVSSEAVEDAQAPAGEAAAP